MGSKRRQGYLPHDIIENILSRLPVKSLLQFKRVCKQWKDTICDPKFVETHVQQSRNSSSSFLVESQKANAFRRVVIQEEEFKELLALEYYPPVEYYRSEVLCHCDGLFLISRNNDWHKISYVLWNPSRRTYKELHYPYAEAGFHSRLRFGICYDPLLKDYKVVVGDVRHYAVFYCRNNSWSEMKEMNNNAASCNNSNVSYYAEGVFFKGCIFWISYSNLENSDPYSSRFEIVCFDGRDETFKNILRNLDCRGDFYSLICSGSGLYFFPIYRPCSLRDEIVIMEKVGDVDDAWMEIKVELPFSSFCTKPLCWTQENKIIFADFWGKKHLLYDHRKRCFTEIQNSLDLKSRLFPYAENLFQL